MAAGMSYIWCLTTDIILQLWKSEVLSGSRGDNQVPVRLIPLEAPERINSFSFPSSQKLSATLDLQPL